MPPAVPLTHPHVRYRSYMDGLRGIAVLAVIFYHARLFGFTGGFVGVDIFFVISGFLITSILVRDLHDGRFSLLNFWERRIRRIFPVLIFVIACTILAAYFFLLYPQEYHHFGSAVIAQSMFLSNVLFMVSDNYFTQQTHYSPLVHTWSLAVEEQFYLLYPFIILGCVWLGKRFSASGDAQSHFSQRSRYVLIGCVALISVVSFFLNMYLVDLRAGAAWTIPFTKGFSPVSYQTAGFYLLPTRAWELGSGALVALLSLQVESIFWSEALAVIASIALVSAMFLFSDTTWFPGLAALLPVSGAAGLIVANEHRQTAIGKALSNRALVWVGLISYSLYLWHVPVFVFANDVVARPIGLVGKLWLLVLTGILSTFSYYCVETQFRKKTLIARRGAVFALGLGGMTVLGATGILLYRNIVTNTALIPPVANTVLNKITGSQDEPSGAGCFQSEGEHDLCRIGTPDAGNARFVVWGDSHAQALVTLFDSLAQTARVQGTVFGNGGCAPVIGAWTLPLTDACAKEREAALTFIRDNDIKTIFLVARWDAYLMGGPDHTDQMRLTDTDRFSTSSAQATEIMQRHLGAMIHGFTSEGRQVYLVTQVPEQFAFDPRTAFYVAVRTGNMPDPLGTASSTGAAYRSATMSVFGSFSKDLGVHILDTSAHLCGTSSCPLEEKDMLLYQDENHVSTAGALKLRPLLAPVFRGMTTGSAARKGGAR